MNAAGIVADSPSIIGPACWLEKPLPLSGNQSKATKLHASVRACAQKRADDALGCRDIALEWWK